ncbi:MAG: DUF2207 domain-containing protein [Pseudomonadota bacterium]
MRTFCPVIRSHLAFALMLLLVAFAAVPAHAAEEILRFHSDVVVQKDGSFIVTEFITVRAEGVNIRRGIYRDFPLKFRDNENRLRTVGFDILSIKRDGKSEPYSTKYGSTGLRIYIGDKDIYLRTGEYKYEIRYATDRQLRYFEDSDEVYWNATGTDWQFPILEASAMITLPEGGSALAQTSFTGSSGSTENNATAQLRDGGQKVFFKTTRMLGRYEGLTVAVKFPKGVVTAPDRSQTLRWFWRDNAVALTATGGAALVFLYYLIAWFLVGRDPPEQLVIPRWDLPDGISPALSNYIFKKGLSGKGWDAITSAFLSLAVKGYITIDTTESDPTIERTNERITETLPVGERAVVNWIGRTTGKVTISDKIGSRVERLQKLFATAMEDEHGDKYLKHNMLWAIPGIALSVAIVALAVFSGSLGPGAIALLVFITVIGAGGTMILVQIAKGMAFSLSNKIRVVFFAIFIGHFVLSGSGFILRASTDVLQDPVVITSLASLVLINIAFWFLIKAPTSLGQSRMADIEGLRDYLNLAEKDRMNLVGGPEMSAQHFEKLLPYAVALDVEKPWSDAFESWMASSISTAGEPSGMNYTPRWYSGSHFGSGSFSRSMSAMTASFNSSFVDAMPAPQSSSSGFSSGGGGFSGGGGGGGGGGGW